MTVEKCSTCKHAFTTGKDRFYCKKLLADKGDCGEYEMIREEAIKTIELVIKIPEDTYKHIMSMQFYIPGSRSGKSLLEEILKAIRTGTPRICSVDLVGGDSQESEKV